MKNYSSDCFYNDVYNASLLNPNKNAIICDNEKVTYRSLINTVHVLAQDIRSSLNDIAGKKIAIFCKNKKNIIVSMISISSVGGVYVPVSSSNIKTALLLINDIECDMVIHDGLMDSESFIDTKGKIFININKTKNYSGDTFNPISDDCRGPVEMIIHSSGTSSLTNKSLASKGIVLGRKGIESVIQNIISVSCLREDVVEYIVSPLSHAFGYGRLRSIFKVGGVVVVSDELFFPEKSIEIIKKYKCNSISSVSTIFAIFLQYCEEGFISISKSILWIEIGSLSLYKDYKFKLLDIMTNARIIVNYGMTEAMRSTFMVLDKNTNKIDSVGVPAKNTNIKILSKEGAIDNNGIGEILIKGDNIFLDYENSKHSYKDAFINGYFKSGDMGFIDDEGFLFFKGRKDDVINYGGNKFYPNFVEELLNGSISDVFAISSIKDARGMSEDIPVLCIETSKSYNLNDINKRLIGNVEEYMMPKYMYILDSIPKTQNGKIKRNQLKKIINKIK